MVYDEDDYLLLSGIQHFCFCKRQWALIHIEQQWDENVRTIEGKQLHETSHDGQMSKRRGDLVVTCGMSVFSKDLGITGACDVVEFQKNPKGISIFGREGLFQPIPVEYKRGSPKESDADILQLCAQAICLEEMLACEIGKGYLYYGETRHRLEVTFDQKLRERVSMMFAEMHQYFGRRYTPKVKPSQSCKACSLDEICMPKLYKNRSAISYMQNALKDESNEEIT
jgi:CRISPR-associated exonuclease Cas4